MKEFEIWENQKILESVENFYQNNQSDLLTEEFINEVTNNFFEEYNISHINDLQRLDEGIFSNIIGAIGGLAFGGFISRTICKILGLKEGLLYNLINSKAVQAAIGAATISHYKDR